MSEGDVIYARKHIYMMYEHVRRVQYSTVHGHDHVATQPKTKRRVDLDRSELIQLVV